MRLSNIHTTSDLMAAAARAATDEDLDALFAMRDLVESWLQTPAEAEAQLAMLDAFIELLGRS